MVQVGAARRSDWNGWWCALVVVGAILLSYPVSGQALWDDFDSTMTALNFARTGHILFNGWLAPTQGWEIFWGALFIKLFGFSFTVVRLSTLPVAAVLLWAFYELQLGFGVSRRNAVFCTLTLGLSPLFLPLEASYMTDVPALMALLLCALMCQKAVLAREDRIAVRWVVGAGLLGVVLGTVRQTALLGPLVMVPSTGVYLRRRRGVLLAAGVTTAVSGAAIAAFLHWYAQQPYAVPEPLDLPAIVAPGHFVYLVRGLFKALFCLLLVMLPLFAMWLPGLGRLNRWAWLRVGLGMGIAVLCWRNAAHHWNLDEWVAPWCHVLILALEGMKEPDAVLGEAVTLSLRARLVVSVFEAGIVLIAVEQMVAGWRNRRSAGGQISASGWKAALWILGPFSAVYLFLLMPRGATLYIQDRYVLPLVPLCGVLLLLGLQRVGKDCPSLVSVGVLGLFSLFAVGAVFTLYAQQRAVDGALAELAAAGVPRTAVSAGVPSDGWTQLELGRAFNNPAVKVPRGAFVREVPGWNLPAGCMTYAPIGGEPVIRPRYFVVFSPSACLVRTEFADVPFRAALPPFRRRVLVEGLRGEGK